MMFPTNEQIQEAMKKYPWVKRCFEKDSSVDRALQKQQFTLQELRQAQQRYPWIEDTAYLLYKLRDERRIKERPDLTASQKEQILEIMKDPWFDEFAEKLDC